MPWYFLITSCHQSSESCIPQTPLTLDLECDWEQQYDILQQTLHSNAFSVSNDRLSCSLTLHSPSPLACPLLSFSFMYCPLLSLPFLSSPVLFFYFLHNRSSAPNSRIITRIFMSSLPQRATQRDGEREWERSGETFLRVQMVWLKWALIPLTFIDSVVMKRRRETDEGRWKRRRRVGRWQKERWLWWRKEGKVSLSQCYELMRWGMIGLKEHTCIASFTLGGVWVFWYAGQVFWTVSLEEYFEK